MRIDMQKCKWLVLNNVVREQAMEVCEQEWQQVWFNRQQAHLWEGQQIDSSWWEAADCRKASEILDSGYSYNMGWVMVLITVKVFIHQNYFLSDPIEWLMHG